MRAVRGDERDPDLRPARVDGETTGVCDAGAHRECAPSAAMRAAVGGAGCVCPCHASETA